MDSPVRPEFLKAFAAGSLEIHCSMILLRQNTADGGHEFKGPGAITVARDRDGFTIRLYSDIQEPLQNWKMMAEDSAWPDPGIILPPDRFYSLKATSLEGYVWTHPRVRVHRNYARTGILITGRCSMLHTTAEPARVTGEEVHHLVFFSDLEIPLPPATRFSCTAGVPDARSLFTTGWRSRLKRSRSPPGKGNDVAVCSQSRKNSFP